MDISHFKTDKSLESNGVWVDIGKGTKLLVARLYNPAHKAALREAMKPYKRQVESGTMDDGLAEDIVNAIMARTILLNWDGLTEGGEPVPYSVEKAVEYLSIPDFSALVQEIAGNMETYRSVKAEEDEKN